MRSVAVERSGSATDIARVLTNLGAVWLDIVFGVAVAGLAIAGRRRDALFVVLAGGGMMLLTNAIKLVVERPRPRGGLVDVSSYSWPSGHAAASIALYGALAVLAARRAPRARAPIWVGLAVLTGVVGATRVYLGVHYPSDVVAGWTLGGLWLVAVTRTTAHQVYPEGRLQQHAREPPGQRPPGRGVGGRGGRCACSAIRS